MISLESGLIYPYAAFLPWDMAWVYSCLASSFYFTVPWILFFEKVAVKLWRQTEGDIGKR